MSAEIEALKRFFAANNRNDMQSTSRDFDPQIVRIEPEGFPTTGIHRGIREVQEHIAKGRGSRADGTCTQADDRVRPKYKSALRIAIRAAL